jgi:hypothetical protein
VRRYVDQTSRQDFEDRIAEAEDAIRYDIQKMFNELAANQQQQTALGDWPPDNPKPGALWFDTSSGQLFVWTGNEWVVATCCGTAVEDDEVDYSLAEQATPRKWIDGRTIYQKTIQADDFSTPTDAGFGWQFPHGIVDLDLVVAYELIVGTTMPLSVSGGGTDYVPTSMLWPSTNNMSASLPVIFSVSDVVVMGGNPPPPEWLDPSLISPPPDPPVPPGVIYFTLRYVKKS